MSGQGRLESSTSAGVAALSAMAETEAKLNLSLDDIISKTAKSSRPAGRGAGKPAGGRNQRNGAAKSPAGGAKARALGVAVGKAATKRQGAAPRRSSSGSASAGRRRIVVDSHDVRPRRPGQTRSLQCFAW